MRSLLCLVAVAMAFCLCGCGGEAAPVPQPTLKEIAAGAQQEAAAAQAAGDAKAARSAADRALAASTEADLRASANPDDADAQTMAGEVKELSRQADYSAGLAEEEKAYAAKIGSMKAKGYRLARAGALKTLFGSLSLTADLAGAKGYEALPDAAKSLADMAVDLSGAPRLTDGKPDWPAVAGAMSAYGTKPPPVVAAALGVALLIMARDDMALYEADMAVMPTDASAFDQAVGHAVRTFAFRASGLPKMAAREMQAVPAGSAEAQKMNDPAVQATFCIIRAIMAAQDKDYDRADLELMRAMKIYPENPLMVYLTGERQVGEGQYEKAEGTLEDLARLLPPDADPWLLQHIQERARYIRDKKGDAEPLFTDRKRLCDLAVRGLWHAAKTSVPARTLAGWVDSARGLGTEFMKYLPGGE
jgi:hypothetical protein